MIANYHTHNRWCRHAVGEIEDYIKVALEEGFEELAITDHVPHSDNIDKRRIQWEEFPEYNRLLDRAIAEYGDRISLIKGFECEYYPESMPEYRWMRDDYGYELLILGQHWYGEGRQYFAFSHEKTADEMHIYSDTVCDGLNTGLFGFLAHPDLCVLGYAPGWDKECESCMRQIFAECEKLDIPVEINGAGAYENRGYPGREAFLLSKEYKLRYLINMDAHDPEYLRADHSCVPEAFARELGIAVMEKLPRDDFDHLR